MITLVKHGNAREGMSFEPVRKMICGHKTEIYSRVCGYFRPVCNWNKGKQAEFLARKKYLLSHCGAGGTK